MKFQFSTEQAANIAALIGFVLSVLKINIGSEEIGQAVGAVLVLGGLVYSWVKRYQRGDLRLSGFRK